MRTLRLSLFLTLIVGITVAVAQTPADRQRAQIQNRIGWESMAAAAWERAAEAFREAIKIDPTFEFAYYGLGRANLAMTNYSDAIVALERSRNLYSARGGQKFASIQEAQRFREDQMAEIKERNRMMGPPEPWLGDGKYRTGGESSRPGHPRFHEDIIRLERNLVIDVSVPLFVSLSLGSAYFHAGRLVDAEREYKEAIASDPQSGEAHNNLAVVFLESGRLAEAEEAVKSAKKTGFKVHPQLEQDITDRRKRGR